MSNYRNTERHAACFQALGHAHRLRIFMRLLECCGTQSSCDSACVNAMAVGELGDEVDIAPATLSHHLKILRDAGLIDMTRDGQRRLYRINVSALESLRELLDTTVMSLPLQRKGTQR